MHISKELSLWDHVATFNKGTRASLNNKEVVTVISLDLSKAFDCVPHGLLLAKVKAYGVAETGIALMRNYL